MASIKTCGLRAQVLIYFTVQCLTLALVSVIAFAALEFTVNTLNEASEEITEELQPVHQLQFKLAAVDQAILGYLINGDPRSRDAFIRLGADIEHTLEALAAPTSPLAHVEEREVISQVSTAWQTVRSTITPTLERTAPQFDPSALREAKQMLALTNQAIRDLEGIYDVAFDEIRSEQQRALTAKRNSLVLASAVLGMALLAMLAAGLSVSHHVLRPISRLVTATGYLGQGDLLVRVPVDRTDEIGQLAASFNTMADKLEEHQAALETMATHDGLTGLYNHAEFMRRLEAEVQRATRYRRPLSLLLFDVDHFKRVNDVHGHVAGDQVLRAIAATLQQQIRPSDVAARYGGEEFGVILPETDGPAAIPIAERIREAIARQAIMTAAGEAVRVTISVGAADYQFNDGPLSTFVEAADRALYAAKKCGRNRVVREETT